MRYGVPSIYFFFIINSVLSIFFLFNCIFIIKFSFLSFFIFILELFQFAGYGPHSEKMFSRVLLRIYCQKSRLDWRIIQSCIFCWRESPNIVSELVIYILNLSGIYVYRRTARPIYFACDLSNSRYTWYNTFFDFLNTFFRALRSSILLTHLSLSCLTTISVYSYIKKAIVALKSTQPKPWLFPNRTERPLGLSSCVILT